MLCQRIDPIIKRAKATCLTKNYYQMPPDFFSSFWTSSQTLMTFKTLFYFSYMNIVHNTTPKPNSILMNALHNPSNVLVHIYAHTQSTYTYAHTHTFIQIHVYTVGPLYLPIYNYRFDQQKVENIWRENCICTEHFLSLIIIP